MFEGDLGAHGFRPVLCLVYHYLTYLYRTNCRVNEQRKSPLPMKGHVISFFLF